MTTSQRVRQPATGSPVRQAMVRSLRGLRKLHEEQAYAFERWVLSCRAPQPCTHASPATSDARAGERPSTPPSSASETAGDRAA